MSIENRAFTTWKFGGVEFLAFPRDGDRSYWIINAKGENFGAWQTIKNFRDRQRRGDGSATLTFGRVRLQGATVRAEKG